MRTVVAGTALLLLVAGCGTKDKEPGSSGTPPVSLSGTVNDHGTKEVENGSIEVEQDDFYFGPTYLKTSHGATVKVLLKNEGSVPHTFTSDALQVDQTVPADDTATVTFTMPASGAVAFW